MNKSVDNQTDQCAHDHQVKMDEECMYEVS